VRRAILAFQFLTRLPTPGVEDVEASDLSRSAAWFPAVGVVVGATVAFAVWVGALRDPWLGAFLGVLAWTWVTGALHLDGLGDLADGLAAAHGGPERLRAAMADPRAGSFAIVAIVLQVLAKLVGLRVLAGAAFPWPLLVLASAARLGPLHWSRSLPPLGPGTGARFAELVPKRAIRTWAALLCAVSLLAPALFVGLAAILAWRWFLATRLGGQTGDALGAGVEVVESIGLLALVATVS
jgi:adenosylcobinamide-GDP ribazoletransferase